MKNNCFSPRRPAQAPIYGAYQAHSVEKVEVEGRILSRSTYVLDDPRESARDVKATDFYLENLLAAGADLKHMTLSASAFTAVASLPVLNENKLSHEDSQKSE